MERITGDLYFEVGFSVEESGDFMVCCAAGPLHVQFVRQRKTVVDTDHGILMEELEA